MNYYRIINGNSLFELEKIKTEKIKINCVVTSPPYFKKREYGDSDKEIGKESSVKDFCNNLADIFDAVPLHPLGSVWVNIGDKRSKNGSLLMVPEQFAITMIERGWLLVDNVIWAKIFDDEDGSTEGGCMIEPALHRLNGNGYEYIYRFVKTKKAQEAWADSCSVRIPRIGMDAIRYLPDQLMTVNTSVDGRCLHNVWRLPMGQTQEKHYAVFPTTLPERPIAMTCPMHVCSSCGAPNSREIEMVEYKENRGNKRIFGKYNSIENNKDVKESGRMDSGRDYIPRKPHTIKWSTNCNCEAPLTSGIVLDPFCGSGTVGEVALKLGRSFIGIDLYDKYCEIAKDRCYKTETFMSDNKLVAEKLYH